MNEMRATQGGKKKRGIKQKAHQEKGRSVRSEDICSLLVKLRTSQASNTAARPGKSRGDGVRPAHKMARGLLILEPYQLLSAFLSRS